jgi:hypothetical protein
MREADGGGGRGNQGLSARLACELGAKVCMQPGRPTAGGHVDLYQAIGGFEGKFGLLLQPVAIGLL